MEQRKGPQIEDSRSRALQVDLRKDRKAAGYGQCEFTTDGDHPVALVLILDIPR